MEVIGKEIGEKRTRKEGTKKRVGIYQRDIRTEKQEEKGRSE